MKKLVKYFLVASFLTTGIGALATVNHDGRLLSPQNAGETPAAPESDYDIYTYREYGEKTETSKTITCLVNLSEDLNGVYARVYVEPGQKAETFRCVVDGYYGSNWFYDRFGLEKFDFDTAITEDLTLYAYNIPRNLDPEILLPDQETGEFDITWDNGANSSMVGLDGAILPRKANKDQVVKFKINFNFYADKNVTVKANDQVLTADENGVYSFKVAAKTTVSVTDTTILDKVDAYTYTLKVGKEGYRMHKNAGNSIEYMVENITLKAGDTFSVEVSDGTDVTSYNQALVSDDGQVKIVDYVCSEPGIYSFFFDTIRQASWVSGPQLSYKFVNNPEWIVTEQPVVYAWAWEEGKDGAWYEAEVAENGDITVLLSKNISGLKFLAFDKDTFTKPNWDNKIGETPSDYKLDPTKLENDGSKIWFYFFGDSNIASLYFKAPEDWTTVNYYTWGQGSEAGWPGKAMTLVDEANRIYKAEVDLGKYANIIFNNGSSQTVDISLLGTSNNTLFELGAKNGDKFEVTTSIYEAK